MRSSLLEKPGTKQAKPLNPNKHTMRSEVALAQMQPDEIGLPNAILRILRVPAIWSSDRAAEIASCGQSREKRDGGHPTALRSVPLPKEVDAGTQVSNPSSLGRPASARNPATSKTSIFFSYLPLPTRNLLAKGMLSLAEFRD